MSGEWTIQAFPLTIRLMRSAIGLIVIAAMIAGCGYRGPLYLPKPKPEAQEPAPKPAAEPSDRKAAGEQ